MNERLISIVVPIYNAEKYFARCLKSLFEQDYLNIEYVFINDCTPDNSMNILNDILEEYPMRQKKTNIIHNKKNKGIAETRNIGVAVATGDYILFVDSDDYIDTNMVSRLCEVAIENDTDIVLCNQILIESVKGNDVLNISYTDKREYLNKVLHGQFPCCIWGKLIKKALFVKHSVAAMPGVNHGEDLQVMIPLYYYAHNINVADTTYFYNKFNASSYTNTLKTEGIVSMIKSYKMVADFLSIHNSFTSVADLQESTLIHKVSLLSVASAQDYSLVAKIYRDIPIWTVNIGISYKILLMLVDWGWYNVAYSIVKLYLKIR